MTAQSGFRQKLAGTLLPRQEFVRDAEKLLRVFLVWIVSRSRNRHDLHLRQCPLQVFLSFSRNDRASAAQYINDGSLDFPDEPPQLRGTNPLPMAGSRFQTMRPSTRGFDP